MNPKKIRKKSPRHGHCYLRIVYSIFPSKYFFCLFLVAAMCAFRITSICSISTIFKTEIKKKQKNNMKIYNVFPSIPSPHISFCQKLCEKNILLSNELLFIYFFVGYLTMFPFSFTFNFSMLISYRDDHKKATLIFKWRTVTVR